MAKSRLHELSELGQSVWIDFLSRQMLQSGKLARMMEEDAVVGVTSNPTIFQKAIAEGDAYDEQLREVLADEDDPKEVFLKLAIEDVQERLRPAAPGLGRRERSGRLRLDRGRPEPRLRHRRHDRGGAAAARPGRQAELLRQDPRDEGRPTGDRGDDRSRPQHQRDADLLAAALREVVEAYLRGLERLVESGGDPSGVASVASFFVSRVDTEADRRLDEARRARRAEGQARGRQRQARLPALQGALLGRALGGARGQGRDGRSAACGPRPRPRTRPTATCSTSRS